MKLTLLLAGAATAGLATTAQAHDHTTAMKAKSERCVAVTSDQVASQFDRFNTAWATKNPDTVTALFADDAVLLATVSNTPRLNHAQIRDYFVTFLRASPVGKIDSSTIKLGCNRAERLGTWTVTLTDPATGQKNDVKARYSFIYKYENGGWKIDHLHSSAMPEKLPG